MAPASSSKASSKGKGKCSQEEARISPAPEGRKKAREAARSSTSSLSGPPSGRVSLSTHDERSGEAATNSSNTDDIVFSERREWYSPELIKRLNAFLAIVDDDNAIYAMRRLPTHLVWMKSSRDFYLAREESSEPVTVLCPGSISTLWLFDVKGNPVNNPTITVQPVDKRDMEAVREIVQCYSKAPEIQEPTSLRASRLQYTPRERGSSASEVAALDQVWDARKTFQSKDKMMRLQPKKANYGETASEWRVSFKLEGIHVLAQTPTGKARAPPLPSSPFNIVTFEIVKVVKQNLYKPSRVVIQTKSADKMPSSTGLGNLSAIRRRKLLPPPVLRQLNAVRLVPQFFCVLKTAP
ncbi:hypothetical protein OF83DRAFT_1180237 [Amylostereum chailletii]|nr:hypothetical protein OF83DRAFT_1180237 [Amylostereum chailletii]